VVWSSDCRYAAVGVDSPWRPFWRTAGPRVRVRVGARVRSGVGVVRSSTLDMRPRGPTPPGPGLLKSGPYSRISSSKVRRFLLRDGFVTAVAGMHGLRTAEGEKKKTSASTSTSTSTIRSGAVDRVYIDGRPNAFPSPVGKPGATFAAGSLRSVICKFSTGHPGPPSLPGGAWCDIHGGESPSRRLQVFNRPRTASTTALIIVEPNYHVDRRPLLRPRGRRQLSRAPGREVGIPAAGIFI
jgi:hypothetical protein